jgi:hypothetical protein
MGAANNKTLFASRSKMERRCCGVALRLRATNLPASSRTVFPNKYLFNSFNLLINNAR